jgi:ferritin-like metal-binding protein YciE
MPVKTPKETFVFLLSHVRHGQEHTTKILDEISKVAQHPEIKQALEARHFVSAKILSTLDEAFKMIGEKPVPMTGRLQEVFLEDFRKELPKRSGFSSWQSSFTCSNSGWASIWL